MSDDREYGFNFLDPEAGSPEIEASFETQESQPDGQANQPSETPKRGVLPRVRAVPAAAMKQVEAPDKDPVLLEIESILSANLLDLYNQMPEDKRESFKLKGEEVASKIHQMILNAKVQIHKILKLVTEWLRLVPGINMYFLQQEAKIKLDRLVDYANEQIQHSRNRV